MLHDPCRGVLSINKINGTKYHMTTKKFASLIAPLVMGMAFALPAFAQTPQAMNGSATTVSATASTHKMCTHDAKAARDTAIAAARAKAKTSIAAATATHTSDVTAAKSLTDAAARKAAKKLADSTLHTALASARTERATEIASARSTYKTTVAACPAK
jgi:hypothetical protein